MPYQKIKRGDIVVFHYPVDPQQHFVKRVIGVPGDRLRMERKKVLINGKPLEEPYVHFLEPPNTCFAIISRGWILSTRARWETGGWR